MELKEVAGERNKFDDQADDETGARSDIIQCFVTGLRDVSQSRTTVWVKTCARISRCKMPFIPTHLFGISTLPRCATPDPPQSSTSLRLVGMRVRGSLSKCVVS